jgi:hypothetical protein
MTILNTILKNNGPLMSSQLSRELEKETGITYNTASQQVSRNKSIKKIKGFFISNQSLCYIEEHVEEGILFKVLYDAMFENGKKYWYCLNAIKLHGGIITQKYLECYTNYPIMPLKSHIPFKIVMQKFIREEVLIFDGNYYMFSPKFEKQNLTYLAYNTIEMIKDDILNHFENLTKNIGLISYNTGKSFAEFGKYRWAFKGVSTISGIMNNNVSGFLLADIMIGHPIYEKDINFFVEKLKSIHTFKNASRVIPFLLVDDLEKEALLLLKKNGIVVGFIRELFGQKYAETLKELISILNNAGASLKQSPEKYLDLLSELKKYNEGLANNIRGALFEFLVGHIHSINSNNSVEIGREIYENGARHEMDVFVVYPDKIIIAECKAKRSEIELEVIEKWLTKKLPAFKKWLEKQETLKNKNIEFEFWSTSHFTEESLERLKVFQSISKKYKISFFQSNDISDVAKKMKNKKLKEAVQDFFLKPIV